MIAQRAVSDRRHPGAAGRITAAPTARLLRRGSYGRATFSIYHPWLLPRLPFYLPPSSEFYPIERDLRTHARADALEFVSGQRAAIVLVPPPPASLWRPSPASGPNNLLYRSSTRPEQCATDPSPSAPSHPPASSLRTATHPII